MISSLATGTVAIDTDAIDSGHITGDSPTLAALDINGAEVGAADKVVVRASDITLHRGGAIDNSTDTADNAGDIDIRATRIDISDEAYISAASYASGDAGDIDVQATDKIDMRDRAYIATESYDNGDAGDIHLETHNLAIFSDSREDFGAGIYSGAYEYNSTGNGGNITILANHIDFDSTDDPDVYAVEIDSSTSGSGNAGDIYIDAANTLTISGWSHISSETYAQGSGGYIDIRVSNRIDIQNHAYISTESHAGGDAGDMRLVTHALTIFSEGLFAQEPFRIRAGLYASTADEGNAGAITIEATTVELHDVYDINGGTARGAVIESRTYGTGNAGSITITDATEIQLRGSSQINTDSQFIDYNTVSGAPGNIDLETDRLLMFDRASIDSDIDTIAPEGDDNIDGGKIIINASEMLVMGDRSHITTGSYYQTNPGIIRIDTAQLQMYDDAEIESSTEDGNGAEIIIDATDIHMRDSTRIITTTEGEGQGGSITIDTHKLSIIGNDETEIGARFNKLGVFSESTSRHQDAGDAGKITITAQQDILLARQAEISSASSGAGAAGTVHLTALGWLMLSGSQISTESTDRAQSSAGITINAGDLLLDDGSVITTKANGEARAGDIAIDTANTVKLVADSRLTTEAQSGGGGNIELITNQLLYLQDSSMTTSVKLPEATVDGAATANGSDGIGAGDGGDILVDPIFIVLDNSNIQADNQIDGDGGNITLIADYIIQSTDAQISASANTGIDGRIDIDAFDAEVHAGESSLTTRFFDAGHWQQQACIKPSSSGASSFVVGQRPLRLSPDHHWLSSPVDW